MIYVSDYINIIHMKWIIDVCFLDVLPQIDSINGQLKITTEISNIEYVVKHYRYLVFMLLIEFINTKEKKYYKLSFKLDEMLNKLVNIINDEREYNRANISKILNGPIFCVKAYICKSL